MQDSSNCCPSSSRSLSVECLPLHVLASRNLCCPGSPDVMRLLNTETLNLETFYDKIPVYAIISHTWESDEVLFQDIENGTAERRDGFAEVKGAVGQAVNDGFKYTVSTYPLNDCQYWSLTSCHSGLTLVASTNQARPSSQRPSTPCFGGIAKFRSAMPT